jgi:hypothetical protein
MGWVDPKAHSAAERIMSMKGTCSLPACSAVRQPAAPMRTQKRKSNTLKHSAIRLVGLKWRLWCTVWFTNCHLFCEPLLYKTISKYDATSMYRTITPNSYIFWGLDITYGINLRTRIRCDGRYANYPGKFWCCHWTAQEGNTALNANSLSQLGPASNCPFLVAVPALMYIITAHIRRRRLYCWASIKSDKSSNSSCIRQKMSPKYARARTHSNPVVPTSVYTTPRL